MTLDHGGSFYPICKRMREFNMNKKFFTVFNLMNIVTIIPLFILICVGEKYLLFPVWTNLLMLVIACLQLGREYGRMFPSKDG